MLPPQNSPLFRFTLNSDLLGKRVLRIDPVGWDTLGISLTRSRKTHGMGVEYSTQLGFLKEGKAYLERAFEAADIDANVTLLVEQYDPNEFAWKLYYVGRIAFLGAEFTKLMVNVNVENTGYIQQFLSRDTVSVDLFGQESVSGLAGPVIEPLTIPLHSRALLQRYEAKQVAEVETQAQMFGDEDDDSHEQVLYFGFDTPVVNDFELGAVAGGWVAGDAKTAVPIYTAKESGRFVFELALNVHIEAHVTSSSSPNFEKVDAVCHFRLNGDPSTAQRLMPDVSDKVDGDYIGDIIVPPTTIIADLQIGDNVYFYADYWLHEIGGGVTGIRYRAMISAITKPGSYFKISAQTQTPATTAPGMLVYDALNRVAQALTDELDVFRSDFFGRTDSVPAYPIDGPGSLAFLTGGFQVRGFPLRTGPRATATPQVITLPKTYYARIASAPYVLKEAEVQDGESAHQQLYFGFNDTVSNELGLGAVAGGYVTGEESDAAPLFVVKDPGYYTCELALDATIEATAEDGEFNEVFFNIHFRLNNGPEQRLYTAHADGVGGQWQRHVQVPTFTFSQTLASGDKLYFYGFLFFADRSGGTQRFKAKASLNAGSYFKLSGQTQLTISTADPTQIDPRKALTTTWSDLFSSLAAVHCLGSGFEWAMGRKGEPVQVIRVEPASYFYSDEVVLDVGSVADVRTKVSEPDYYQVVELGYEQWQAEQVNGLEEFNSTRQWTTPLKAVKATYSQLSKFATAGMLIETTRRQRYDASSTTDDSRDATNFLISLVREGASYTTERNQRLLTSIGLFSPETAYNIAYSPGRMLRNHGAILRAGLLPTGSVRFTSGTGNTTMVSQLQSEPTVIAEGSDVAVTDLGAPRWRALTYEFTAPVSRGQHQRVLARPKGRIRFTNEKGKALEGWILDYKHTAGSQLADFTLLACAT